MISTAIPLNRIRQTEPAVFFADRKAIRDLAQKTLGELAISLAMGSVCSLFVATPAGIGLIAAAIAVQTIANLAIRSFIAYSDNRAKPDPSCETPEIARWLAPALFASATLSNGQILVHESGHALAARALLQQGRPSISLIPFRGGFTEFFPNRLSSLGKLIGKDRVMPFVSAAGPLFSLGVSSIAFAAGLAVSDQKPELSRMLIVAALLDFFVHIIYAISAFFANPADMTHDFVSLWIAGVHPAIPLALMVATLAFFVFRQAHS